MSEPSLSITTCGLTPHQLAPNLNPGEETDILKVTVMIPVKTALALWYAPMKTVVSLVVPEAPPRIILQDQTSGERGRNSLPGLCCTRPGAGEENS